VDPTTGTYSSHLPTPTGIPSDPSLAAYGVVQSQELAAHLCKLDPPVDVIYSSPFYRCLQTLVPTVNGLNNIRASSLPSAASSASSASSPLRIHVEPGLGEFYGLARFDHPSPASTSVLSIHFPNLLHHDPSDPSDPANAPTIRPSPNGESIPDLHDRIAYCLHRLTARLDADPTAPEALLICTHAASMICIGRALTGVAPAEYGEEDFRCFTCAFSRFVRRGEGEGPLEDGGEGKAEEVVVWDPNAPETIPDVRWREGRGVGGGWECEVNGDCSFLGKGEERGWYVPTSSSSTVPCFLSRFLSITFLPTLDCEACVTRRTPGTFGWKRLRPPRFRRRVLRPEIHYIIRCMSQSKSRRSTSFLAFLRRYTTIR